MPFLLKSSGILDDAWLICEERDTVRGCIDIIAEALFRKRPFASRGKRVAMLKPKEIGAY